MKMSNAVYDVLKWIATIVLPSLAVLYGTLGKIWGLPYTEQIPLSITAIQVFMTALLGISTANYYKDIADVKEEIDTIRNDEVIM